jgi:hypothetical protein
MPPPTPSLKDINRAWIFATANQFVSSGRFGDKMRQRVVDNGFTDVAIFVNGKPGNFRRGRKVVNDFALNFHFLDKDKIRVTRQLFEKAGIDIHLMTWIKPSEEYIEDCAKKTLPLCEQIGARSLMFDVEEPWHGLSASHLSEGESRRIVTKYFCPLFGATSCCLGVTHQVGGDKKHAARLKRSIGPLLEACDYSLPQAYTNTNSGDPCTKKPGCLQKRAVREWSTFDRTIVMGLRTRSPRRIA